MTTAVGSKVGFRVGRNVGDSVIESLSCVDCELGGDVGFAAQFVMIRD